MLRRTIAGAGATALLATAVVAGITPSAGAQIEQQRDFKPWGSTSARDQVLRRGCHHYAYHYEIHAPTNYWAAEIFLVNPRRVGLASDAIDTNSDPDKGNLSFVICRPSTVYGEHKIRMKVTYCSDRDCREPSHAGFVKPSTFRLTRPR